MAQYSLWYKDRYLLVFLGTMIMVVAAVMASPILMTHYFDRMISRIDSLAEERQAEQAVSDQRILDNMTHLIIKNGELITVLLEQHDSGGLNQTLAQLPPPDANVTGKISSFIKSPPQIVKDESGD